MKKGRYQVMLRSRKRGRRNARLLDTTDRKLREYMSDVAEGVKPKDLRTYLATSVAASMVNSGKVPKDGKEYKKRRGEVAKTVSAMLGNTPTVALASYIAPSVFGPWEGAAAL